MQTQAVGFMTDAEMLGKNLPRRTRAEDREEHLVKSEEQKKYPVAGSE